MTTMTSAANQLTLRPWMQTVIKVLGLISLANLLLRIANVTRNVPQSDFKYRVRFCDTLMLASGFFAHGEYQLLANDAEHIRTFIDLGCNVGLFPLYLGSLTKHKELRGIMVDGNPRVVAEAKENIRLNGMSENITVIHGLAAADNGVSEREFCITQNSLSSTVNVDLLTSRLGMSRIKVPVINVLSEFRTTCPEGSRIDLLKLDIEGCELEFLETNFELIDLCDRVILEFHKPKVTLACVRELLESQGFSLIGSQDHADLPWGIAYFRR